MFEIIFLLQIRIVALRTKPGDGYIAFDDYGHPTAKGVKRAVDETIDLKRMEIVKHIGHEAGYNVFNSVILVDSEGVICKVL